MATRSYPYEQYDCYKITIDVKAVGNLVASTMMINALIVLESTQGVRPVKAGPKGNYFVYVSSFAGPKELLAVPHTSVSTQFEAMRKYHEPVYKKIAEADRINTQLNGAIEEIERILRGNFSRAGEGGA
ncbi:hypothetical protein LTR17_004833 [Elasticomyces elasticus]|nr:hypothetical protein LTR17_004833 [Elasticomyces elasticus]